MELQKTKHEIKLAQWREAVLACRNSGTRVRDWCEEQGISVQTYYRWQRQVWNAGVEKAQLSCRPVDSVTFAQYRSPMLAQEPGSGAAVVICFPWGRVEIQNGAEQAVIENTLQAAKALC